MGKLTAPAARISTRLALSLHSVGRAAPPRQRRAEARRLTARPHGSVRSPHQAAITRPATKGTTMKTQHFDIHQAITDTIISAIERGAGEFRLPWHRSSGSIVRPINVGSNWPYRGVNIVTLWAISDQNNYSSGLWGTYRQWAEAGAQSPQGRKGGACSLLQGNLGGRRRRPARNPSHRPRQSRFRGRTGRWLCSADTRGADVHHDAGLSRPRRLSPRLARRSGTAATAHFTDRRPT